MVAGPATRRILHRAARFLAEAVRADAREAHGGARFAELAWAGDLLPPASAPACSAALLEAFAGALETAARRLAALCLGGAGGGEPPLLSTGAQLAALGLLEVCDAMAADAPEWGVAEPADALARARADFRVLRAIALDDADALLLLDAALDGIERSPVARRLGLDELAVGHWFHD
jgi:hypothetical protein